MASTALRVHRPRPLSPSWTVRSEAERWAWLLLAAIAIASVAGMLFGVLVALVLLGGIGFVAAIVGFRRPPLGLHGAAMLCTLDAMLRVLVFDPSPLPWNTLNFFLVGVAALGMPFLLQFRSGILRLLQALLLLLAVGLLVTPDLARGLQDVLGALVVLGLVVYFARASQYPAIWYWSGVVAGATGAATGLLYFTAYDVVDYVDRNAWGLASLTALVAITLAYLTLDRGSRGRVPLVVLAIVNATWIFLSASRGSMLVAVVCLLFLVTATPGMVRRMALAVAALALGGAVLSQFDELRETAVQRVENLVDRERSIENRTSHRSSLVVGGWRIFRSHPLVGVGTGGFIPAWRQLSDTRGIPDFRAVAEGREAHTAWVKVLAENGVPGGIALTLLVASFALCGLSRRADRRAKRVGLLATTCLVLVFLTTEYQSKAPWYLMAGAFTILHLPRIAAFSHSARANAGRGA